MPSLARALYQSVAPFNATCCIREAWSRNSRVSPVNWLWKCCKPAQCIWHSGTLTMKKRGRGLRRMVEMVATEVLHGRLLRMTNYHHCVSVSSCWRTWESSWFLPITMRCQRISRDYSFIMVFSILYIEYGCVGTEQIEVKNQVFLMIVMTYLYYQYLCIVWWQHFMFELHSW